MSNTVNGPPLCGGGAPIASSNLTRARLEACSDQLRYALARSGCSLPGWRSDLVLLRKALLFHQQLLDPATPLCVSSYERLGRPWDELLETMALLIAHLAEGRRDRQREYRLVALVYDHFGGVQDMHQLMARYDSIFLWIQINASLRRICKNVEVRMTYPPL